MIAGICFPFLAIALAELGDKTQLAILLLASKTERHAQLLAGVLAAFLIVDGIAVLAGNWVANAVPLHLVKIFSGIAFLIFGIWTLKGHKEEAPEDAKVSRDPFLSGFLLIFFSEWGDKTQIAAGLFGARYPPVYVLIGAMSALALLSIIAVYSGKWILSKIDPRTVSLATGIIFIAMGVLTILF